MITVIRLLVTVFLFSSLAFAEGPIDGPTDPNKEDLEISSPRTLYHYSFPEREHSAKETLGHLGVLYAASWVAYYVSQPKVFREKGSFSVYRHNFGKVVFDKDEPFWNWLVHPISGSQLYLYFRANGYKKIDSVKLAFVASSMFEFLVEIYTEPASFQDLYQTPLLGSALGLMLEKLSFYFLNYNSPFFTVLGHILNPMTLFWFYEGKTRITPSVGKGKAALQFEMSF